MTVVSTRAGTNLPLCISSWRRYRTSANWYLCERCVVHSILVQNMVRLVKQYVQSQKKIHTSEEKKPNIICIYTCMLCDSRDDSLFKHLFNTETRHTQNIKWDWGFFFKKTKGNRNEITIILSSQILKMN